jgi:hypothetical protein
MQFPHTGNRQNAVFTSRGKLSGGACYQTMPVVLVTLPLILAEKIHPFRGYQILMTDLHIQDILRNWDEQRIHSRTQGK